MESTQDVLKVGIGEEECGQVVSSIWRPGKERVPLFEVWHVCDHREVAAFSVDLDSQGASIEISFKLDNGPLAKTSTKTLYLHHDKLLKHNPTHASIGIAYGLLDGLSDRLGFGVERHWRNCGAVNGHVLWVVVGGDASIGPQDRARYDLGVAVWRSVWNDSRAQKSNADHRQARFAVSHGN